jgi:HAD superfamily hydrolase (TIGR01509 family)
MLTKVEKKPTQEPVAGQAAVAANLPPYAVLFELDNVAINGRKIRFQVLKALMAKNGVELDAGTFARFCMHSAPESNVEKLVEGVGAKKLDTAKLTEEYKKNLAEAFLSKDTALAPGLQKFLENAHGRGVAIAALSAQSQETAERMLENLGLNALDIRLMVFSDTEKDFPRADAWLKVAKTLSKSPRRCIAIASSMSSCKAALSADMYSIAVPDEFTAFQDFSGANIVADSLTDLNPKELLDAFCRSSK